MFVLFYVTQLIIFKMMLSAKFVNLDSGTTKNSFKLQLKINIFCSDKLPGTDTLSPLNI